jgi:hypothetical protein
MAVVQISKIQVRRGQKNQGTGIPQLASGEFGWAVDAQELYIGNGAVSEGSPAVGNTQILTSTTDIFSLAASYEYQKDTNYIMPDTPRTLQNKLDDFVTAADFGMSGEVTQDATEKLQTALDQLYLNVDKTSENSKVTLYFAPGVYSISDTIYIPPQVNLVGAGKDKTIIRNSSANATAFISVNADSSIGSYADHSTTTTGNQCSRISIKDLNLETTQTNNLLQLDSCKDSEFSNVVFKGAWDVGTIASTNCALVLNNLTSSVTSNNLHFYKCDFDNFSYGVYSDWDVNSNAWNECKFSNLGLGLAFGTGLTVLDSLLNSGKRTGARSNEIENSIFSDISRQAIHFKFGNSNISRNNTFLQVGNEQGAEFEPLYAIIEFEKENNLSDNDSFSRTEVLANTTSNYTYAYIGEIKGRVSANYRDVFYRNDIIPTTIAQTKLRLPADTSSSKSSHYIVDYSLTSLVYNSTRRGSLHVIHNSTSETVAFTDEYDYVGDADKETSIRFSTGLANVDGDGINETINVQITNNMPSDDQTELRYQIKLLK